MELPGVRFDDFVVPSCEACLREGKNEDVVSSFLACYRVTMNAA